MVMATSQECSVIFMMYNFKQRYLQLGAKSVCQRPGFNPRSGHAKNFKNGTWCHLAKHSAL